MEQPNKVSKAIVASLIENWVAVEVKLVYLSTIESG